jgi:hypothetical protein
MVLVSNTKYKGLVLARSAVSNQYILERMKVYSLVILHSR